MENFLQELGLGPGFIILLIAIKIILVIANKSFKKKHNKICSIVYLI